MKEGNFILLVGVTYRSAMGPEFFQTGKAFALFRRSGNKMINFERDNVPIGELAMVPQPMGGSFAT
jgi:hypothetical protein